MRIAHALLACALAAGCVPPKTYSTPSGKPEVEFGGGTKTQVKDAIVATMLNAGYSVKAGTDYTIVFEAPTTGLVALLTASRYDPQSMYRVTYTLVEGNGTVRVQARVATVTNPGSAFERVMDITDGKAGNQLYQQLLDVRSRFIPAEVAVAASPAAVSPAPSVQPTPQVPAPSVASPSAGASRKVDPPRTASSPPKVDPPPPVKAQAPSSQARTSGRVTESSDRVAVATVGAPGSDSARAAAVRTFRTGQAYVDRHEWGNAEDFFRQSLRLDGSVADYHAALGSVEMILGKWEEAEAEYTAASLIDVNNSEYRAKILEARRRKAPN